MSLGDALHFEKFFSTGILKAIKKDPKRLFLGLDPFTTKVWNKVLGRNDKPIVNQLGGPTKQTFRDAQAQGIKTGTASTLHGAAKAVAGAYGAYAGGNALAGGSAAGGAGTGTIGGATGGTVGGGTADAVEAGGAALPVVTVTGSTGGGLGTAGAIGAGAGGTAAASGNSGSNWRQYAQMGGGQNDQSAEQQAADERRRQLEQWMEQERLRREAFQREQIAKAMYS